MFLGSIPLEIIVKNLLLTNCWVIVKIPFNFALTNFINFLNLKHKKGKYILEPYRKYHILSIRGIDEEMWISKFSS